MKVYVFGNADLETDNSALRAAAVLKSKIPDVAFVTIKPNEDLPFLNEDLVVLMDVVLGITKVRTITEENLDQLVLPPRGSVHDFDLGFQLKYLKKLGKIKRFIIIGLPLGQTPDYDSIQLILRKLVAQDMQGS